MPVNMIETRNLTKQYGPKTAVNNLSLRIGKGELFSLLGVNGAGKTTTIRMLTCLSAPTSGEAFVGGFSCTGESEKIKPMIGISTQDTAVAERLTVRENLEFMARIYGFDKEKTAERVNRTVADFHLEEVLDQRAGTLSGGWKRKLSIAMALIGEPSVLFLDGRARPAGAVARDRIPERFPHDCAHHSLHGRGGAPVRPARHYDLRPDRRLRNAAGNSGDDR